MMNKRMFKLLFELMKNSKKSDREIARTIGVSQPTITRMRQRLEKKAIVEYTVIPDWKELGFEIMAFTFVKSTRRTTEKAQELAMENSNIVFATGGDGMGMDYAMISLHQNFSDFSSFITNLKVNWGENLQDLQSFLMITDKERIMKPFSFKYLEKAMGEEI